MRRAHVSETAESNQSLWLLTISPSIWALHFLLCYITAAVFCAKYAGPDNDLQPVRLAIVIYTVVALGGISWIGWLGYRRQSLGSGKFPHDDDTPQDRHRFLGFATLLLSGLSAVAVIYAALVAIFFGSCN